MPWSIWEHHIPGYGRSSTLMTEMFRPTVVFLRRLKPGITAESPCSLRCYRIAFHRFGHQQGQPRSAILHRTSRTRSIDSGGARHENIHLSWLWCVGNSIAGSLVFDDPWAVVAPLLPPEPKGGGPGGADQHPVRAEVVPVLGDVARAGVKIRQRLGRYRWWSSAPMPG